MKGNDDFTPRVYQSEADYALMRGLLVESLAHSGPPVYATIGNLDWWRVSEDEPPSIYQAHLWFDAPGRLVAFAWPTEEQVDILLLDVNYAWQLPADQAG